MVRTVFRNDETCIGHDILFTMHVWAVFYNKNNRLNTVSIFVYLNILLRPFFQLRSDLDFLAHQYGDTVSKVLI